MFEDVYNQTADEDTLEEFSRLIEDKKKQGKKDNQACYYFVPPSTNSRFTPHKPKPAPYGKLLSLDPAKDELEDSPEAEAEAQTHTELQSQTTPTKKKEKGKRRKLPESPVEMDEDSTLLALEPKTPLILTTPPHKRARRDSESSDSSLSELSASPSLPPNTPTPRPSPPVSAPAPAAVRDESHSRRHSATTAATAAGADTETATTSAPPPTDSQPIKRRGRSLAAKTSVSDASNPNSPTLPPNASHAAGAGNMPGRLSSPVFPNLSSVTKPKATGKKNANKDKAVRTLPSDDATTVRRSNARASTISQTPQPESHIRGSDMKGRVGSAAASSPAVNLRKSTRTPAPNLSLNLSLGARTTRSAKRTHDEIDNSSSPIAPSFIGEATPAASSRAATPTNLRPTKKQRTGLRIKTSPMKKKGGTAAGVPRASGEGSTSLTNGGPTNQRIQVYFEGVKVGPEGEYEDVVVPVKPKKKGYEEAPDFFKVRDTDGSAVLCHNCQHPAADNRAIIPCSLCGLHWHLDCLDPPLAIPPVVRTWRCPVHADDLLATLPDQLAPAHRFRKIKGAPVITPAFSRGMKNNGFIEIEEEESEDESTGWSDVKTFGRIYKLPAKGVVLDFISQLRKDGAGYIPTGSPPSKQPQPQHTSTSLAGRSLAEQQAVLNLAELASHAPTSKLDELTQAVVMNADPVVLSMMARGSAENIANGDLNANDKQSLRAMLSQMEAMSNRIRSLLGTETSGAEASAPNTEADQSIVDCNNTDASESVDGDAASIKNESVEPPADLPTPATTTQDNPEPVHSLGEKSSQEIPTETNEDDVTVMDID
ncbi:Uncharacterized protein C2F7.07c [Colletotrichum chlorophyti]|uniref:Uncharacterized protein C2F7.07c n=1 Tax=Colletotrichum chlorophyti TaxID=708187 RepID=A0A1Q8RVD0_9PEZI|nr:Uncharacterized protein C2F7.07c [Colletotrichum chlorophyti]